MQQFKPSTVGCDWYIAATHKVRDTPDFCFEIEEHRNSGGGQFCMAHIAIHRWSPAVLKRMSEEWRVLRTVVTCPLYATAPLQDAKWQKFVSRFGFRPLDSVITNGGAQRTLFVSP